MSLEKKVADIINRNKRVEGDKAWETSYTRRVCIILLTYFVMLLTMMYLNISRAYINALIPTLGFGLSTLSLSVVKKIWIKSYNNGADKQ